MTETGKIMQAVDAVEHDLKHCGYLRKEATEQYLPTLIRAAKRSSLERVVRGSTPELSDASTGWWWLWCDEQWCAAYVKHEATKPWSSECLDVALLRASGGMSRARLRLGEIQTEKWGGRIAAPNAKLTDPAQ